MHTINLPENKNIALMFSGGADSSILLYLLHKHNIEENKNCIIQSYTVPRRTGARDHTANVINCIRSYLKIDIPNTILVGDPNIHHSIFLDTGIDEAYQKYKPDLIFIGTTQNPDTQLNTTFDYPARETVKETALIKHPFSHFDKSYILSLYFEYKIEEMLKLTHSCSVEVFGRCNYCFFCKEREWAFTKLGLTDPGTN